MTRLVLLQTFLVLAAFAWTADAYGEPRPSETYGTDDWDCPQSQEPSVETALIDEVQKDEILPCAAMDAGFGSFCHNAQVLLLSHEGITFCRVTFPELEEDPLPLYESRRAQVPSSHSTTAPAAVASKLDALSPPGAKTRSMWPTQPRLESAFFEKTPAKPG